MSTMGPAPRPRPARWPSPTDIGDMVQTNRVHRRLYTDPDVFEMEMTQVFAASWCYLAHESEIPSPGDFVTTTLGRRPVIVTRGGDGAVHALLNRCTHRGIILTTARAGCAKRFACPYHGWTFANDGRLVGLPFPFDHPVEDRAELALGRLEVASYRGFVFGTLNAEPMPLVEWLGLAVEPFDTLIDRHPEGELRVARSAQRIEFRGNWKLSWDNAADGLHATFAHDSYNKLGKTTDVDTVLQRDAATTPMLAKALGHGHMLVDQRPGIPAGPWSTMRAMPFSDSLEGALRDRGAGDADLDVATGSMLNLSVFPNLIFVGNQLMIVEPLAVDRTVHRNHLVLAPGAEPEIDLLRLRVDEDFVSFDTPDDMDMFDRVQRGLAIPEMEWIDVSRGLVDGVDVRQTDGTVHGPITSEAPQRGYLAAYRELMMADVTTRAR